MPDDTPRMAAPGAGRPPRLPRRPLLAAPALALAAIAPGLAQSRYPARPVQIVVPWAAGGGTDAVARMIASLLERDLGQPFVVVNRTGGSGVVGHAAISTARPDGYTIGLLTLEIAMLHWIGLTELTPRSYTPIALMNQDPAGVLVNASSPYEDIRGLAQALQAAPPRRLKGSGSGRGGSWHLAFVGWLRTLGLGADHVLWVPVEGAALGMQELAAGGVDLAACSLPEGKAMIDARRVRPLAVMAQERIGAFAEVPTLKESLGTDYAAGLWRGIAGPPGLPEEVRQLLGAALGRVSRAEEFTRFMAARGFGTSFAEAAEFAAFMDRSDAAMGQALRDVGLAKG
ncbi:tripartite tricarboxylate transporter substrate binding protein [Siccirubricoccus sp. KC 17139]|uniref:Tripartite tricarboxylate transporter substrate binding protein n=1 Tax=Siccirubricoccus soli TaxID=2899147 RepID=A0ABT1DDF9_9PROT|nr:tripartite tricarboxylate transporter substrate binding protein [Siccirubricoccus soli]MCO6419975.1 tripartite tricarboxylate transporter substrate binding protein [Siccirubricoccus soli]MCP2686110.1 tripartite tricarboxylate transporter substrate binding protein [Siccirubricoccus soli]